nr:hypothetical protein [Aerococcus urinaeequi]
MSFFSVDFTILIGLNVTRFSSFIYPLGKDVDEQNQPYIHVSSILIK